MSWLILHIDAEQARCEAIEDAMLEAGAAAVTLQDSADQPLFEPDPGTTPLWQNVRISGMYTAATDLERLLANLQTRLGHSLPLYRAEILEDKDWVRSWMDSYQPMPMGQRLWICPSWLSPPRADAVNLVLDPGMAFGTGTHPTTAMCLRWLDAHEVDGLDVIDYGCGSGILAIAALLLGAVRATGTDIDPQAITASRANAERNQVTEAQFTLCYPREMHDAAAADLVLANILAGPLTSLSSNISPLVKAGGQLLMSGILAEQAPDIIAAYPEFEFAPTVEDDGWVLLEARKNQT